MEQSYLSAVIRSHQARIRELKLLPDDAAQFVAESRERRIKVNEIEIAKIIAKILEAE